MSTSVIRPHLRNVHKRPLPAEVLCARICTHNKESIIAVGARDGVIRVYAFDSVSLQSSWENTSSHSSSAACAVTALTFYITDVICIIGGNDRGELIIWNVSWETKIRTLDHRYKGAIRNLRIEQHHHVLASVAADGRLILWDLLQGKRRQVHRDTTSALTSVCFARNGKWVMTGSEDGNVRIYDMMRGVLFCTLCAPNGDTNNMENNVGSVNGAARGNGESKREKLTEAITCVEFHPEREVVATGSDNGHLCIWDWQHSVLLHHCYIAELTAISALCFCQNRLLTTSERVMHFYTISKSFEHEQICTDWHNVYDLCYNNEKNEILVSCCCDNAVLVTGHWPLEHSLVESIDYENDFADYGNGIPNTNMDINVDNDNNIHRRVVDCEQTSQHKQKETPQSNNIKNESDRNLHPLANASENNNNNTNQQLLNNNISLFTNDALNNENESVLDGKKMYRREKVTASANDTKETNGTTTPKVSHEKLSIEPELMESMLPSCNKIENKNETIINNNNNNNTSTKVSNTVSTKESKEKTTLTSPIILNESSTSLQTNKSAQRDVSDVCSHHKVVNRDKKDVQVELVREGDATCKVLIERLEQLKMIREEWAEEPEEALQYLIGLHGDGWESIVCDFFTAIVESKLVLTIDMLPTILTLFESLLRQDSRVLGTQPKLAALRVLRVLNAQLRPWIEREICQVKQLHNNLQVHEYKLQEQEQQRRLSSLHSQMETLNKKDNEVHLQGNLITDERSSNTNVKNANESVHQDVSKCSNGNVITVSTNKKVNNEVDSNCYVAKNAYDELALLKMREELDECTRDALELLNEPGSYQEELRHIVDDLQALSE